MPGDYGRVTFKNIVYQHVALSKNRFYSIVVNISMQNLVFCFYPHPTIMDVTLLVATHNRIRARRQLPLVQRATR
jgi:hypothetical protein